MFPERGIVIVFLFRRLFICKNGWSVLTMSGNGGRGVAKDIFQHRFLIHQHISGG